MIEVENNANVTLQGGRPEKKNVLGTLVSPCFLWLGARAQGALPLGASRECTNREPPIELEPLSVQFLDRHVALE